MPTQADLDALDAAIASGAQEVRFQDRTVRRYTNITDMLTARTLIYNELHPSGVSPQPVRQLRIFTDRGL